MQRFISLPLILLCYEPVTLVERIGDALREGFLDLLFGPEIHGEIWGLPVEQGEIILFGRPSMPQLDVEPTHRVIRPKAEDYPQTGWKRVMGQREKKEAADEVLGKMRQQLEEMKTDDKILSQH